MRKGLTPERVTGDESDGEVGRAEERTEAAERTARVELRRWGWARRTERGGFLLFFSFR